MSLNIDFWVETDDVIERFPVFQTPTEASLEIINSPDPVQKYQEWVQELIYSGGDQSLLEDHLQDFQRWVEQKRSSGLKIQFGIG